MQAQEVVLWPWFGLGQTDRQPIRGGDQREARRKGAHLKTETLYAFKRRQMGSAERSGTGLLFITMPSIWRKGTPSSHTHTRLWIHSHKEVQTHTHTDTRRHTQRLSHSHTQSFLHIDTDRGPLSEKPQVWGTWASLGMSLTTSCQSVRCTLPLMAWFM